MKYAKLFVPTFLALAGMVFFASCDDKTEVYISWPVDYYGQVEVTPDTAKIGDAIQLSMGPFDIGGIIGFSVDHFINGENVLKSISYYIDDVLVTESSDSDNNYAATYEISDISAGTHKVTAHCNPNSIVTEDDDCICYYDITINEHIGTCTLTIEE